MRRRPIIVLTTPDHEELLVNVRKIVMVRGVPEGSLVSMTDGGTYPVCETARQIADRWTAL